MWGRFQRPSRWMLLVPALLGAWIAIRFWQASAGGPEDLAPESLAEGDYRVLRIIDGDTIVVGPLSADNDAAPAWQARVRLIGIDCPETPHAGRSAEPWGAEAKAFAAEFLTGGQAHLRLDKRRRDRSGRFVAYAFVGERHLNEELLRAGLARMSVLNGESLILARQMQVAEGDAKTQRRGIWSGRD